MAHVAAGAAGDDEAQILGDPLLLPRRAEGRGLGSAADAQRLLVLFFVADALLHLPPNLDALLHGVALLALAPWHQLGAEEIAVAVVHDRAGQAALELDVGGVVAGDRPLRHPLTDVRAHAAHYA